MRNRKFVSQSGFTLVELLIVIVIIGILAGVVIGVLNPVQQQNRARDGATRAQLDKIALSTKSLYVSSPRSNFRSPNTSEFFGGLGNATAMSGCAGLSVDGTVETCLFRITGQSLPVTCAAATNYQGHVSPGGAQCDYAYQRNGSAFWIAAKGAATPVVEFVYYYNEDPTSGVVTEGFYTCPTTFTVGSVPLSSGCSLLN